MTSPRAPLRARLVIGPHDGVQVVRWRRPGACRRLAVSGDLIAADQMTADAGSLEIADVIYRCATSAPSAWLADTLDRYPGCSAAAIPAAGGRCLVASRASPPVTVSFLTPNERAFHVLVAAIFVHGWLCAGWPLAWLDPPWLEVAGTPRLSARTTIVPIPFRLLYDDRPVSLASSGNPSSPSRRRMESASGASMPA